MMLEFPRLDETEAAVAQNKKTNACRKEKAISHAANILGRTFEEVLDIYDAFGSTAAPDRFYMLYFG
jgi:hypothetical protein